MVGYGDLCKDCRSAGMPVSILAVDDEKNVSILYK
jgi:hypothetical protein